MLFDVTGNGCDEAGDAALHVHRAATVHHAVFDGGGKGRVFPVAFIAGRHDVGMAREHQVRAVARLARIEVFDIGRAFIAEDGPLHRKPHRLQHRFQCRQRAAFGGRYGWAADEGGEIFGGIDG